MPKKNPSVHVEKFLYGREEAAWALSISLRSIDEMIADKRLSTRRFGRRVLIPAAEVRKIADTIIRSDMLQGVAHAPN